MLLAAQDPVWTRQCSVERAATEAEPAIARANRSVRVKIARLTWHSTLAFLTSASTSYGDRMAAAYQTTGESVEAKALPSLWKALARYGQGTWVQASPCERFHAAAPRGESSGLPGFPATAHQRIQAPWQWQAQRALGVVNRTVTEYYRSNPAAYSKLVEEVWKTPHPPGDYWEAYYRWQALRSGPRSVEWLRSLVRLAWSDQYIGYAVAQDLSVCCQDTFHFEELVHMSQIVILMSATNARDAEQAAYWAGRLAHDDLSFSRDLRRFRTATGIAAVARWAAKPQLDPWTRYYSFAGPLMQMLDKPPVQVDPSLSPDSPAVRTALDTFDRWYASQRDRLEREAEAEAPYIRQLTEELFGR